MILGFDTVVAHAAMMRTWRAPDIAAFAVLRRHFHCSVGTGRRHNHGPFCGGWTKVERVVIRISWCKGMQISRKYLLRLVEAI